MDNQSNILKVGVSGHREFIDVEETKKQVIAKVKEILLSGRYTSIEVYTALAGGADTDFATAFAEIDLKIPVVYQFVLPFSIDEYKKDFSSDAGNNELLVFENWLKRGTVTIDNTVAPKGTDERNEAYYKTGKRICDTVDFMFLLWDGRDPEGQGGTGSIAKYLSEDVNKKKRCTSNATEQKCRRNMRSWIKQHKRSSTITQKPGGMARMVGRNSGHFFE